MGNSTKKVLLVEDDPMVQEVNRQFIERVDGFEVIDVASDGTKGLELAKRQNPDLIILDIYMPEKDGMETLKQIRADKIEVDVIVITAAKDKGSIRWMLQNGAFDYIVKPFKYERMEQALLDYKNFQAHLTGEGDMKQQEIDDILSPSSTKLPTREDNDIEQSIPKGLNKQTLKQILSFLTEQVQPVSAEETADHIGIARVTARRYLDYLQKNGQVEIDIQYGGVGRPINRYKMV
ncbi:response regulator [Pontibacillus yanchengensis]|uniref:Chemotaxis protein CheY n=1 Tax=Pontibacillus yanchengensis Y32 TaxID=1385514 RepID=A0A0A2TE98_9BACI|nr:response regulator [Pontibacillus yanchengensis]KGP74182.1 chemotaxis protein CheY [Pontibacillus yanchengensis Y32]